MQVIFFFLQVVLIRVVAAFPKDPGPGLNRSDFRLAGTNLRLL